MRKREEGLMREEETEKKEVMVRKRYTNFPFLNALLTQQVHRLHHHHHQQQELYAIVAFIA